MERSSSKDTRSTRNTMAWRSISGRTIWAEAGWGRRATAAARTCARRSVWLGLILNDEISFPVRREEAVTILS
jgi:hypothetical protein